MCVLSLRLELVTLSKSVMIDNISSSSISMHSSTFYHDKTQPKSYFLCCGFLQVSNLILDAVWKF